MPLVRLDQLQQFAAVNLNSDPGAIGGPVVVPSCAQITLHWTTASGKGAVNVLYGRYSGTFAGTVAQANAIFSVLTTGAGWTGLANQIATTTALASVGIRDVNQANQPVVTSTSAAVPGTGTGTELPDEMAICVTLRTAFAGRAGRGRMYLPGFTSADVGTGNIILAGTVSACTTWANTNIASALSGSGYTWSLGLKARQAYVGETGTSHPARAATSVPITAALVRDNHWDSQRRRGLK